MTLSATATAAVSPAAPTLERRARAACAGEPGPEAAR
jgi:hypothetical protein